MRGNRQHQTGPIINKGLVRAQDLLLTKTVIVKNLIGDRNMRVIILEILKDGLGGARIGSKWNLVNITKTT
jgi:hypothetical protein